MFEILGIIFLFGIALYLLFVGVAGMYAYIGFTGKIEWLFLIPIGISLFIFYFIFSNMSISISIT